MAYEKSSSEAQEKTTQSSGVQNLRGLPRRYVSRQRPEGKDDDAVYVVLRRGLVVRKLLVTYHSEAGIEVVSESPKATVKGWTVVGWSGAVVLVLLCLPFPLSE